MHYLILGKGKVKWHRINKGEEVRSNNFKSPLLRFLLLKDLLKIMTISALWRVVSDFFFLIIRCTAGVGFHKSRNPLYVLLPWLSHLHADCVMWLFKSSLYLNFFYGVCANNHSGTCLLGGGEWSTHRAFEAPEGL